MTPRRKSIKRGAPPKRVNKERRAKNFERAYGGKYADWIRSQKCGIDSAECEGPSHAHHTQNGGMSRKADAKTLVPLCTYHHNLWHTDGAFRVCLGEALIFDAATYWHNWRLSGTP
jgi:hypothetical protein